MNAFASQHREHGVMLVVVLWTVASMALLVSAFNASVRGSASVIESELNSVQRGAALEAGLEIAAAALLAGGAGPGWPRNGEQRRVRFGKQQLAISLQDASGLIDLNKADGKLLLGLLKQFTASKQDAELARDRILDWRDQDDKVRFHGAEDFNYERAGLSFGAGDTDFVDVTQLEDVLGVGSELYRRIAAFLTVYGGEGQVNLKMAPATVLQSVPDASNAEIGRAKKSAAGDAEAGQTRAKSDGPLSKTREGAAEDTSNAADEPDAESDTTPRDVGRVVIVQVTLLDARGQAGLSLKAAIMPAADAGAPYRILSWGLTRIAPAQPGAPS
ncbi:MAG: general secretion pathway protein GspK [Methyloligellaceae bacterium]